MADIRVGARSQAAFPCHMSGVLYVGGGEAQPGSAAEVQGIRAVDPQAQTQQPSYPQLVQHLIARAPSKVTLLPILYVECQQVLPVGWQGARSQISRRQHSTGQ